MPSKKYHCDDKYDEVDIHGNNAAFLCPVENCGKVFIVNTTSMDFSSKKCPKCGKSRVTLLPKESKKGGAQGGKILEATIEWD